MYGNAPGAGAGQAIFTDDVSLQVFMEALKRLVCVLYRLGLNICSIFLGCWCSNKLIRVLPTPGLIVVVFCCCIREGVIFKLFLFYVSFC